MSRPATPVQLTSAVDGGPFAAEVRALRTAAGLTHAEAAQRVGVSPRWWYYLHAGTRRPRPSDVLALARLDPLAAPMVDAVLEALTKGTPAPPGPALAVAHLAALAGYPLADVSEAAAHVVTREALAALDVALERAAVALERLDAMEHARPMDSAAATRVGLLAALGRLDVILPRLTGQDPE